MIDTFPPIPMGVSEPITKQKKWWIMECWS
jgi:hypothetical protein